MQSHELLQLLINGSIDNYAKLNADIDENIQKVGDEVAVVSYHFLTGRCSCCKLQEMMFASGKVA
jgi:hypothetical protein